MDNVLTLDIKGVGLALLVGGLIFVLGEGYGPLFLFDIILFLILAAIVTTLGKLKKQGLGQWSKRGWQNVLSNGLVPVVAVFAYWLSTFLPFLPSKLLAVAYIASVSAVTADKFASEIGLLDGEPIMLLTLRKVKKGTSGGITWAGTLASVLGSALIGLSVFAIGGSIAMFCVVVSSGYVGNLVDTVMGYFEEQGIGNKHTSNLIGSLAGYLLCVLLLIL